MDGISAVCRNILDHDPYAGTLFVFFNKARTSIRCYVCDGHGEWLIEKRVAKGRFCRLGKTGCQLAQLEAEELMLWLRGGDPNSVSLPEPWKKMS